MENVTFLYKPAYFGVNIDEKDLDFYANERTEDLRRAGALTVYESYWSSHEVYQTSVYGAIPENELDNHQKKKLSKYGWREAEVSLRSVASGDLENELLLRDQKNYIVIKEQDAGAFTLLNFYFKPFCWF